MSAVAPDGAPTLRAVKPLGQKAYGSIAHLPKSRMGPSDHHCHAGQARIATEKTRDRHDVVIVQEKLDGSCCSVAKLETGELVALGRAGHLAQSSRFEQHQLFAAWVRERLGVFDGLLKPGERVIGEWLAQAHGTRYRLTHDPFVAFDLMAGIEREPYDVFLSRVGGLLPVPFLVHRGGALSVDDAMRRLGVYGAHGATDPIEGAVWRVERKGAVDYLAKYVRADKVDGCYLPEQNGGEAVWNWRPSRSPQGDGA